MTSFLKFEKNSAGWFLVSVAAFSLGAVIDYPVTSVLATGLGLVAVGLAMRGVRFAAVDSGVLGGWLVLVVVGVAITQRMGRFSISTNGYRLWAVLALACGVVAVFSARLPFRRLAVILALATLLVASASILVPDWEPIASSDVYRAHAAAGSALVAGENPYSDAVQFESGDPFKPEGTLVEGYPYPPPPLIGYGISSTFTDPRLISFVSWVVFATALAVVALRRRDRVGSVTLGVLVLVTTMPIWRMALFMSWTEPLSLALLAGSIVGIAKGRGWGWFVLGLALASKQYLVLLAPIALLYQTDDGKRPGWMSIGTAAVVAGFPAIFGAAGYYDAIIGHALDIGFRPDTQSINGAIAAMGGDSQIAAWLLVPFMLGVLWIFIRAKLPVEMLPAAGVVVLVVALLMTSAFPNYWMFVSALAGISAICAVPDNQDRWHESATSPGRHMD